LSVMVSSKFSAVMLIVVIHLLLVGDRLLTAGFKAATVSTAHAVRLFHTHSVPIT